MFVLDGHHKLMAARSMQPPARLNFLVLTADDKTSAFHANTPGPSPGRALPLRRSAEDIQKARSRVKDVDSDGSDSDTPERRPPPRAFRCDPTTCLPQQYVANTLRIAQQLDQARRRRHAIRRIAVWRKECERLVREARARRKAVVSKEFEKSVQHWCDTHSGEFSADLDWSSRRMCRLFHFVHPKASVKDTSGAVAAAIAKCRENNNAGHAADPDVGSAALFGAADGDCSW